MSFHQLVHPSYSSMGYHTNNYAHYQAYPTPTPQQSVLPADPLKCTSSTIWSSHLLVIQITYQRLLLMVTIQWPYKTHTMQHGTWTRVQPTTLHPLQVVFVPFLIRTLIHLLLLATDILPMLHREVQVFSSIHPVLFSLMIFFRLSYNC